MSRKNQARPKKSLCFESLESRRLLAVAAFEAELLQDESGAPGEVIVGNVLEAGESFFLRITAREFHPFYRGIGSTSVNVNWDSSLLGVIEEAYSPDQAVTENLPVLRTGVLNQKAGSISHLGGTVMLSSNLGRPIGDTSAETLALVPMRAGATPGNAIIQLGLSPSPTVLFPFNQLANQRLRFGSESITIVEADKGTDRESVDDELDLGELGPAFAETRVAPSTTTVESVEIPAEVASEEVPFEATNPPIVTVIEPELVEPLTEEESIQAESNAAVDQVLSFDMNRDGIFDFADFGLMNISVASVDSVAEAETDTTAADESDEIPAFVNEVEKSAPTFLHTCLAFPKADDVIANEAWLDSFAIAWLADADAREKRRREAGSL